MNVKFVTHRPFSGTTPTLTPEQAKGITRSWLPVYHLFHDIETNGIDPYINKLLLEAWWNGDPNQPILVLDSYTVHTHDIFDPIDLKHTQITAHNADFEARWALYRGLTSPEYYCTLVADRTILSGAHELRYDIIACLLRRKIDVPVWMNKDIRGQFVGADPATFTITDEHILYNAGDVWKLPELRQKQQVHIDSLGMNFLIHGLRSPLIKILAQCELTGFVHDTAQWLEVARKRKIQADTVLDWLDAYAVAKGLDLLSINKACREERERLANRGVRLAQRHLKLSDEINRLESVNKTHLKAYQITRASLDRVIAEMATEITIPPIHINWSASGQAVEALKALGITPLPAAKDNKTHQMKVGVGKAARSNWFADNEQHLQMDFMKKFDKYKKLEHNIKSFGNEWVVNYTNPVTGKVHTIFRQTGTKTGRFASGDKDLGYFNLQQIPGSKTEVEIDGVKYYIAEYRVCFKTDPGRKIGTFDYTGCEIICMISLSNDLALKAISELPDQHSYMGTKCWRAVYADRYKRTGDPKWKELSETYVMDKNTNEGDKARKKFKESGVFPVIYGVRNSKVASIQGFSNHEGGIFIKVIEDEMPNVVTFVKSKADFALRNGYVLHNTRTNSRRWFTKVLDSANFDFELSNGDKAQIETAARNSPIQGTNVDIIVEAIVTIARWARLYKVDIRLLGQVHDELIYDFPEQDADWIAPKIKELMKRAAQRYLIPEISMDVDCHVAYTWTK